MTKDEAIDVIIKTFVCDPTQEGMDEVELCSYPHGVAHNVCAALLLLTPYQWEVKDIDGRYATINRVTE